MTNHPNRGWRKRWSVDLTMATVTHENGLSVRFTMAPGEPGVFDGEVVAGEQALDGMSTQEMARLMRESGDIYIEARQRSH